MVLTCRAKRCDGIARFFYAIAFSQGLTKKNRREAVFFREEMKRLFEFDFFVFDMLASFGIEFHDRHFLGHGFFVFAGRVEMTGAGR